MYKRLIAWVVKPWRERLFLEMLKYAMVNNTSFIEVGSNDGMETAYVLKRFGKDVKAYVIEPDQLNMANVKKRIKGYFGNDPRVAYFPLAISLIEGPGKFYKHSKQSNLNSAVSMGNDYIPTKVTYTTLNAFFTKNNIKPPVLIKMDIEGHEVEVLQSGIEWLCKHKDIALLIEVHPQTYNKDHSFAKILKQLFDAGYKTAMLETAGLVQPDIFKEEKLKPIDQTLGIGSYPRGLYAGLDNNFVLRVATKRHNNKINRPPYQTTKIVRSLLLVKK